MRGRPETGNPKPKTHDLIPAIAGSLSMAAPFCDLRDRAARSSIHK